MSRRNISSGGPWEDVIGYSRAVRVGAHVHVSGTTSMTPAGLEGPGDAHAQARRALQTIEEALRAAGATLGDVVRTRMYVTSAAHADAVGRAHAEFFARVKPASTLVVVAGLVHPDMLVEIEAEAFVDGGP